MPAPVPERFSFPTRTGIASRKPVRGSHHSALGEGLNYLRGTTRTLVPATRIDHAHPHSTTRSYTVPMQLGPWMRHLWWFFRFRITGSGVAVVLITDPSGGTRTVTVGVVDADVRARSNGVGHVETLSAPVDTGAVAVARTITFARTDSNASATLYVDTLMCSALARDSLEFDANDLGIDIPTLRADTPIFDAANKSLGGVARAVRDQDNAGLHGITDRHLFLWKRPNGQGLSVLGTPWVPIFDEGPCVQASHRYIGETLRRVYCGIAGTVSATDTLEVRFTATSGDTATITTTNATPGVWPVLNAELDVYAEDLDTDDGRRLSTDEIVTIEARVTGPGTKQAYLEGLVIYESRVAT